MAISKKIVTSRKKKERAAPQIRRGSKIQGPSFEGWENWTGEEYHKHRRSAQSFLYENYKLTDLLPEVWAWMKENKYSISDIRAAKAHGVGVTTAINCKLLRLGMPDLNLKHSEYVDQLPGVMGKLEPASTFIIKDIKNSISKGKSIVVEEKKIEKVKAVAYVPTIQERVRETAGEIIGTIEETIDEFISDPNKFDPKTINAASILRISGAKPAHTRIIKNYYQRLLSEYNEVLSVKCDASLAEGYKKYTKRNIMKMRDFLNNLISSCEQVAGEAKIAKKPRAKKIKPVEELVKKVKFKATDDRYNIASVPPTQIIGAQTAVVFNTKLRKIGVYVSKSSEGLTIKGATIMNFDEKSHQRTLRKPEMQLKEFKDITTAKRAQVWLNNIKTTNTPLSGRLNNDVMILKVWK